MLSYVIKILLTALIVVAAAEVGKRNALLGAVIGSLPIVTILAASWLWKETGNAAHVASYLDATVWLVLASLPLFVITPALLRAGWAFWPALGLGAVTSAGTYALTIFVLNKFGNATP